jgi:hypothetical protein
LGVKTKCAVSGVKLISLIDHFFGSYQSISTTIMMWEGFITPILNQDNLDMALSPLSYSMGNPEDQCLFNKSKPSTKKSSEFI